MVTQPSRSSAISASRTGVLRHALARLEHAVENPAAHELADLLAAAHPGEILARLRQHRIACRVRGGLRGDADEIL
jgi:hypothetical protein